MSVTKRLCCGVAVFALASALAVPSASADSSLPVKVSAETQSVPLGSLNGILRVIFPNAVSIPPYCGVIGLGTCQWWPSPWEGGVVG